MAGSDLVMMQIISIIDRRTTTICLHAAGMISPADEPFHTLAGDFWTPPFHVHCRSLVAPWQPGYLSDARTDANAELQRRPLWERRIGPNGEGPTPAPPDPGNKPVPGTGVSPAVQAVRDARVAEKKAQLEALLNEQKTKPVSEMTWDEVQAYRKDLDARMTALDKLIEDPADRWRQVRQFTDAEKEQWSSAYNARAAAESDWLNTHLRAPNPHGFLNPGDLGLTDAQMKVRDSYVVDDDAALQMLRNMRDGKPLTSKARKIRDLIDEAEVVQPVTTYRGAVLGDDVVARLEPGQGWTDRAFQSTDLERSSARDYADVRRANGARGRTVLFEFNLEPGDHALYVGYGEVVVQQGVEFVIESVREAGDELVVVLRRRS